MRRALLALLATAVTGCSLPFPEDVPSIDASMTGKDAPDGKPCSPLIAFAGTSVTGKGDIFTVSTDGHNLTNVTMGNPGTVQFPTWSPDGQYIAFLGNASGHTHVFVIKKDGAGLVDLTPDSNTRYSPPTWSPTSTQLAFDTLESAITNIYVANRDGSNLHNVSGSSADNDVLPAWAPDGSKIAFGSDRAGGSQIFTMSPSGANKTQLTFDSGDHWNPIWSPDGSRISYYDPNKGTVYVLSADGTKSRILGSVSTSSGLYTVFSWSHASDRVAMGNRDIYTVKSDGSSVPVPITTTGDACNPAWSPDDSLIAFNTACGGSGGEIQIVSSQGGAPKPLLAGESPVWQPACE
jgi:TolB protein